MTSADVIRWIVIGQAVFLVVLIAVYSALVVMVERAQLGRLVGLLTVLFSQLPAIVLAVVSELDHLERGGDVEAIVSFVFITMDTFGFAMLVAYLSTRSDRGQRWVKSYLKK
jgi:hypothetical protein